MFKFFGGLVLIAGLVLFGFREAGRAAFDKIATEFSAFVSGKLGAAKEGQEPPTLEEDLERFDQDGRNFEREFIRMMNRLDKIAAKKREHLEQRQAKVDAAEAEKARAAQIAAAFDVASHKPDAQAKDSPFSKRAVLSPPEKWSPAGNALVPVGCRHFAYQPVEFHSVTGELRLAKDQKGVDPSQMIWHEGAFQVWSQLRK